MNLQVAHDKDKENVACPNRPSFCVSQSAIIHMLRERIAARAGGGPDGKQSYCSDGGSFWHEIPFKKSLSVSNVRRDDATAIISISTEIEIDRGARE